ncbi:MAG: hypothetical protein JWR68_971 [Polaromonas sp.]|nr:hypothetical protein [Polaromonas sp.]
MPTYALDFEVLAKILSPILVALAGGIWRYYFRERSRLIYYFVHSASLPLPPSAVPGVQAVHTHAVVVRNVGNKTATKVRIAHEVLPESYRIYPMVHYTVEKGLGSGAEIVLPTLVPNEQVQITYLYFPPTFWHHVGCYVKSEEGLGRQINMLPSPPVPKPVLTLLWLLIFLGATTVVYWTFHLVALALKF